MATQRACRPARCSTCATTNAHCGPRHGINRLLHYGLVARFQGLSPTPWFDGEYYLQSNPDVQQSGHDPLEHFQRWGWREGRSPLPGLDMRRLLSSHPEMRVSKGNALAMFASGELAHLVQAQSQPDPTRTGGLALLAPAPFLHEGSDLLDPARWADIQAPRRSSQPKVDVIIPVYGGAQETLRCLWSVLTAPVKTPYELIVINDAGPVPELNAMLRSLAAARPVHPGAAQGQPGLREDGEPGPEDAPRPRRGDPQQRHTRSTTTGWTGCWPMARSIRAWPR